MPDDDDRTRRRLGDATKSRIADLASGWSVDGPAADRPPTAPDPASLDPATDPSTPAAEPATDPSTPAAEPATDPSTPVAGPGAAHGSGRPKRKTNPPPPPGSPERKALEDKIIATKSRDDDVTDVVPQDRRKQQTGSQAAIATPADPRATQPQGSRERKPTGQHVVSRDRVPTGAQPVIAVEPQSTQPHAGVPGRAKEPTRPPPPPGSPERAKASTGSQPIAKPPTAPPPFDRARVPTGSQSIASPPAADRTKASTGSQSIASPPTPPAPADRTKASTGSQPAIKPPTMPPLFDRAKASTGSQPIASPLAPPSADRAKASTGSQSIPSPPAPPSADRAKASTGSQSIASPPTPPPPADRAKASTGSQPAIKPPTPQPAITTPAPPSRDRAELSTRSQAPSTPPAERTKPASVPPPVPLPPVPRTKAPSDPPSGPKFPRATYDGPAPPLATETSNDSGGLKPFTVEQRTPAVIVDTDAFAGNAPPQTSPASDPVVPTGEFDTGADTVRQITAKRDAAEAILKIPDAETPVEDLVDDADGEDEHDEDEDDLRGGQGDRIAIDPQTAKFERGDPTQNAPPDATEIQSPRVKQMTGGTLRRSAALRRKRGLYGDVRYVFTALFGVRRSKTELAELEHRQSVREISRRRHLVTLGRAAATMDDFDHPALGKARDLLATMEDERAKHAGAVAASDAELDRVRRERENNVKQHAEAIAKADAELAELAKKLEPLEKESTAARKKAAELRDELQRIDLKIKDTEALLVSVKGEKMDKAGIQADIATLKANKQSVLRDEPMIASELDALNPRIAALDATRAELQKKKLELDKADQDDQRRTLELLEAIGAKRKVVERASADAEAARDTALFNLGDRLYVDRPSQLTPQLSPIDRIDLEIGEDERRSMEIKEILSNIDKTKFARGFAMIILAFAAASVIVWLLLSLGS